MGLTRPFKTMTGSSEGLGSEEAGRELARVLVFFWSSRRASLV